MFHPTKASRDLRNVKVSSVLLWQKSVAAVSLGRRLIRESLQVAGFGCSNSQQGGDLKCRFDCRTFWVLLAFGSSCGWKISVAKKSEGVVRRNVQNASDHSNLGKIQREVL